MSLGMLSLSEGDVKAKMKIPGNSYGQIPADARVRNSASASCWVRADGRSMVARLRALAGAGNEGQSLVEFAIAMPLLLMVTMGIITFSMVLNHQEILTQAVGVGGQYLQQIRSTTTDPCKDTFTAISNAAPYLNSAQIGLTLTMNGTSVAATTCSGDQTDLVQGGAVTVAATYPCKLSVYGINFAPGCTISAQVTEYEY